jgi:hypothetical protein
LCHAAPGHVGPWHVIKQRQADYSVELGGLLRSYVPTASFEALRFMTRILEQIGSAVISLTCVLVVTGLAELS